MRHWYWNHCGKKEQWFVNKIIMINYIIIAIGQRHFIICKARFFQNLSTFLGCSCSVYFKMDRTWHHRELVLSLRSYWCHSNHGIAHASDTTIIRFASTHNVHKHCAQCARQLNSNFSLTLSYLVPHRGFIFPVKNPTSYPANIPCNFTVRHLVLNPLSSLEKWIQILTSVHFLLI